MTAAFGSPRHHYAHTDSTNARARALAALGAPSGTVVTAAEQSAGRGRRGRAWSAPAGRALLYTAILRSLAERHALLPLAVPLAVADAIEALAPVECELKWPNDVWIERRKAAGILLESRPPEWALIGIGLNVSIDQDEFPSELRWPATSVGHGATVEGAVEALNDRLARWVGAEREEVLAAFRRRRRSGGRRDGGRDRRRRKPAGGDGGRTGQPRKRRGAADAGRRQLGLRLLGLLGPLRVIGGEIGRLAVSAPVALAGLRAPAAALAARAGEVSKQLAGDRGGLA